MLTYVFHSSYNVWSALFRIEWKISYIFDYSIIQDIHTLTAVFPLPACPPSDHAAHPAHYPSNTTPAANCTADAWLAPYCSVHAPQDPSAHTSVHQRPDHNARSARAAGARAPVPVPQRGYPRGPHRIWLRPRASPMVSVRPMILRSQPRRGPRVQYALYRVAVPGARDGDGWQVGAVAVLGAEAQRGVSVIKIVW